MVAWRDYEKAVKMNATILETLNKENSKQIQENHNYIKTIGEVLLLNIA